MRKQEVVVFFGCIEHGNDLHPFRFTFFIKKGAIPGEGCGERPILFGDHEKDTFKGNPLWSSTKITGDYLHLSQKIKLVVGKKGYPGIEIKLSNKYINGHNWKGTWLNQESQEEGDIFGSLKPHFV